MATIAAGKRVREEMIRTQCTRQTAITNGTPPVGDNYRSGRGGEAPLESVARGRCGRRGKKVPKNRNRLLKPTPPRSAFLPSYDVVSLLIRVRAPAI